MHLRTVERFVAPLRAEAGNLDRATLRFETPPGRQMQIDFGEKWIEVAGSRVKAFVFVATLGYPEAMSRYGFKPEPAGAWILGRQVATMVNDPLRKWLATILDSDARNRLLDDMLRGCSRIEPDDQMAEAEVLLSAFKQGFGHV